jgi:hypothetical protein
VEAALAEGADPQTVSELMQEALHLIEQERIVLSRSAAMLRSALDHLASGN